MRRSGRCRSSRARARRAAARARARRRTRAARSPPARRSGARCERSPASTCSRRPASVATSGSTAWVAAEAISSTRPAPRGLARRAPSRSPSSASSRSSARAVALGLGAAGRAAGLGSTSATSASQDPIRNRRRNSLRRSATPVGLELVGEHRGDRHRQPLGDLADRQVGADHGVEQPLLAERIGAEALDVGHVASGGRSPGRPRRPRAVGSRVTDRDEVERPVEVALGLGPQGEVGGGDRGHEAVVERLRDPQRRVDAVPAGADRELVQRAACGRERGRRARPARSAARAARGTRPPCTRAGARGCRTSRRPPGASVSRFGVET